MIAVRGAHGHFRRDRADQKGQVQAYVPADGMCAASKMNSEKGRSARPNGSSAEKIYAISRPPSMGNASSLGAFREDRPPSCSPMDEARRIAANIAAAAYGMCLALREDASDEALERAYATLLAARPTAINLKWALEEMMAAVRNRPRAERTAAAYRRAAEICDEDVAINKAIGRNGLPLIEAVAARKKPVRRVTASLRVTVSCDDVTLETGLSAAQPLRRHRGVTASLFGA